MWKNSKGQMCREFRSFHLNLPPKKKEEEIIVTIYLWKRKKKDPLGREKMETNKCIIFRGEKQKNKNKKLEKLEKKNINESVYHPGCWQGQPHMRPPSR